MHPAPTEDGPAVRIPPAGTYTLDTTRSTITFRTRHMFGLGPVRGSFGLDGGEITVADPVGRSAAHAAIAAGSFGTGNGARDGVVRSAKYLDTTNHSVIRFVSDTLTETGDGWVLAGTLTVREVERPVRLSIERCDAAGGELTARATTRIDRTEFGITAQRGMIGRYLDLVLDVVAT